MKRRSLSTRERVRLFELHGGRCHICLGRISPGESWDVEHVTPLAMGGADDDANRKPAHRACHAPKTKDDAGRLAKAKRRQAAHIGAKAPPKRPMLGSKASAFKRKLDGRVERRTT